jgi:two-component system LytT family sensor kinase
LNWFENIPRVWKQAYLFIGIWYAANFAVSAFFEWRFENPNIYVLWNAFFLYISLMLTIALVFGYSHLLFRLVWYWQAIGHLVGIIGFFLLMGTLYYVFNDYMDGLIYFENWKESMIDLLSWDALRIYDQYIIVVAVYHIIQYFQGLQRKEQERSALMLRNKEMQIDLLKSQINPHFLFNTLNSISTLVSSSKEQARRVISQLSDVFRYALDAHGGELVKLVHEVDFIENYIRIQQVRFGERLRFVKNVDTSCLSLYIPPMILQPLVENSVKYGIAPKDEGGTISLTVQRQGDTVFFEVKDDGLGTLAKKVMDGSSSGIGMTNTDLRLRSYFGADAGLRVSASDKGYAVQFTVAEHLLIKTERKEVIVNK